MLVYCICIKAYNNTLCTLSIDTKLHASWIMLPGPVDEGPWLVAIDGEVFEPSTHLIAILICKDYIDYSVATSLITFKSNNNGYSKLKPS